MENKDIFESGDMLFVKVKPYLGELTDGYVYIEGIETPESTITIGEK